MRPQGATAPSAHRLPAQPHRATTNAPPPPLPRRLLNVAEKPSVAKSISKALSNDCNSERGRNRYCPVIKFTYHSNTTQHACEMVFTSVLGHLCEQDFADDHAWAATDPATRFDAPLVSRVPPDMRTVAENIVAASRGCDALAIWTDCDREGEHIAREIRALVPSLPAFRARFTGVTRVEVERALKNLTNINEHEADAVEARIELDLRIGAAFTRLQTLSAGGRGRVLSFGPCQIPTLNFIIQRDLTIEKFIPEKFYGLECAVQGSTARGLSSSFNALGGGEKRPRHSQNIATFKWTRGHLFDLNCAILFFEALKEGTALVTAKKVVERTKMRPLPLRTVEFQRVCAAHHRIPGHRLMQIAERLYNQGYISYPRTETNAFPESFNPAATLACLCSDPVLGDYASQLSPTRPRRGQFNDQAHSPIFPLREGTGLEGEDRRVFEFVARHFLACVSDDARGLETEYTMEITGSLRNNAESPPDLNIESEISDIEFSGTSLNNDDIIQFNNVSASSTVQESDLYTLKESFTCKGLIITARNYLDVYPYDKWAESELPSFEVNMRVPNKLAITTGATTPPLPFTESELIGLMDRHGIGTDATIHEHIHKIQMRGYARLIAGRFRGTSLGHCLIKAYSLLKLDIHEPALRSALEAGLREVCEGRVEKTAVVARELEKYRAAYRQLACGVQLFKQEIEKSGGAGGGDGGDGLAGGLREGKARRADSKRNGRDKKESLRGSVVSRKTVKKSGAVGSSRSFRSEGVGEENRNFSGNKAGLLGVEKRVGRAANKVGGEGDVPQCACGYDTVLKVARTAANSGRAFYCCNKSYKKCKFFQWADEKNDRR